MSELPKRGSLCPRLYDEETGEHHEDHDETCEVCGGYNILVDGKRLPPGLTVYLDKFEMTGVDVVELPTVPITITFQSTGTADESPQSQGR